MTVNHKENISSINFNFILILRTKMCNILKYFLEYKKLRSCLITSF